LNQEIDFQLKLKKIICVSDVGVCAVRRPDGGVDGHLLADVSALQVRDQRHRGLGRRHLGQEARQRRLLLVRPQRLRAHL